MSNWRVCNWPASDCVALTAPTFVGAGVLALSGHRCGRWPHLPQWNLFGSWCEPSAFEVALRKFQHMSGIAPGKSAVTVLK